MNQQPSTSSQRLPSFRGMDSSIQNALLNKAKINKKNYVPNLSVSRNVQPKASAETKPVPAVSVKKEPVGRDSHRPRREHKLLAPVETLVPASDTARNALSVKSRSKVTGASSGSKLESIDRMAIKKVFNKQLPEKFEGISSASSLDLPVPVPSARPIESGCTIKKINPLLGDILTVDAGESPLFLLKTPKYVPALLDNAKNTVHDLPEGQIGKLQILKSGKLRLVLGECKFWLNKGVKTEFREELAIVKTDCDTKSGEIISLGEVKERVMLIPDMVAKFKC